MVVWSFGWKIGSKRLEGQRSPRVLFPISLVNIKIPEMLLRPSLSLMTKVGIKAFRIINAILCMSFKLVY